MCKSDLIIINLLINFIFSSASGYSLSHCSRAVGWQETRCFSRTLKKKKQLRFSL